MIRGFIGMIHLAPLPGDPCCTGQRGFANAERRACDDAQALVAGGVDALLIENYGSLPFFKGDAESRTAPHAVALMGVVARQCAERHRKPIGINCLRNDAFSAMSIAAALGLDFIRVNVHTGSMLTDQGLIEGEAASTLRLRHMLQARSVAILADVLVKHATPLAPTDPIRTTRDNFERGLADGVIVTGAATGAPISLELLRQVRQAAGKRPVFLGSGLQPEGVAELAPWADGAIVGSWLKHDSDVQAPVDVSRVRMMADALKGKFRECPT